MGSTEARNQFALSLQLQRAVCVCVEQGDEDQGEGLVWEGEVSCAVTAGASAKGSGSPPASEQLSLPFAASRAILPGLDGALAGIPQLKWHDRSCLHPSSLSQHPWQLCCSSPRAGTGALQAMLQPGKHSQLSKEPEWCWLPPRGNSPLANPGYRSQGCSSAIQMSRLRCSFLHHSSSYFMYLFSVSNSNVFLLRPFWCSRVDFAAQAMDFEDELKAAQSSAMDTGSGSDLDLLSFTFLCHQPNQNIGSASPCLQILGIWQQTVIAYSFSRGKKRAIKVIDSQNSRKSTKRIP